MDVEVEGRGDVGMAEYDADGFVIAVAFDATGGETVAQSVKFKRRYAELFHQLHVVVAVGPWFNGLRLVAYDVVVVVDNPLQRSYYCHQRLTEWNFASGVCGLRCVDPNLIVVRAVSLHIHSTVRYIVSMEYSTSKLLHFRPHTSFMHSPVVRQMDMPRLQNVKF